MRLSHPVLSIAAACAIAFAPLAAFADTIDGQYSGASSIAGGTGECWGNNPASASVFGGTVTIRYVAYDGSQDPIVAAVKPDGSFTASQAIKGGTISYAGRVHGNHLTATWKGPVCYGTLDLSR